jgi:hypothetical protein
LSAPPKDVAPSDLWLKLTQRPRPKTVVPFPSKDKTIGGESIGDVALWVLTESELHSVRANADKVAKEFCGATSKSGDLGYEDAYRNEAVFQLVCIACRNPSNLSQPAFVHPKLARQILTTDEIAQLAMAYNAFRLESGPLVSEMTAEEMEAWLQVLREGGSRVPLARLSGEALSDLVMFLVSKLTPSTGTGSAGSPPGEPSPEPPHLKGSDLVDRTELERAQE